MHSIKCVSRGSEVAQMAIPDTDRGRPDIIFTRYATGQKIKRYRISGIRPDIVRMAIPDKDRGRPDIISDKHSVSQTDPDKAMDGPDI